MLKKVPKGAKQLGIVISSQGGSLAQAHIIRNKINQKVLESKLELLTFGEDYAINAGFMLLMSGHRVYADTTTVLGGL